MKLRKSGLVKRPLCLEHLERRAMLAGDVTAWEDGGTLFVRGDNNDNAIAIVETDDGGVAVVGLSSDGDTTEVNNGDFDVFFDVERIHVDLRRGDDTLLVGNDVAALEGLATAEFENLDVSTEVGDIATIDFDGASADTDQMQLEWLFVQLADGNDEAGISVDTEQRIHAELGKNNNELFIFESFVGDDIIVRGGKNADVVSVSADVSQVLDINVGDGVNSIEAFGTYGQSVIIHTGKNSDDVTVELETDDDLIIVTGSGNDTVNASAIVEGVMIVNTGSGNDDVLVEAAVGENLEIITGSGNDDVTVAAAVDQLLKVDTGNNNDVVAIEATAEVLLVFLGSGNDIADISALVEQDFVVQGGSGNDDVSADVDAGGVVIANMGSGNDDLVINIATGFEFVGLHGGSGRSDDLTTNVDEDDDDVDITGFENVVIV